MKLAALIVLSSIAALAAGHPGQLQPDPPNDCADCAGWNRPTAPFRLFANTYYVGTAELSALLVTSDQGHVLLDGALPQSAPLIDANIRALGFRTEDVRFILNSHAHFDHAGGINALQRASGAIVVTSASGAEAMRQGLPTADDPQAGFAPSFNRYPAVQGPFRIVADRDVLRLGPIAITAHMTPGHTPGSTSWAWQACAPTGGRTRCLHVVYADSLTAVSAPGFRFTGGAGRPSAVERFRASMARVASLPCDIVVSTHPDFTGLQGKREKRGALEAGAPGDPMVDPQGCRAYAEAMAKRLDVRVSEEANRVSPSS